MGLQATEESNNEELETTSEELETANKNLQSLNEGMQTMNEIPNPMFNNERNCNGLVIITNKVEG